MEYVMTGEDTLGFSVQSPCPIPRKIVHCMWLLSPSLSTEGLEDVEVAVSMLSDDLLSVEDSCWSCWRTVSKSCTGTFLDLKYASTFSDGTKASLSDKNTVQGTLICSANKTMCNHGNDR
jgi:hypothetical protein